MSVMESGLVKTEDVVKPFSKMKYGKLAGEDAIAIEILCC